MLEIKRFDEFDIDQLISWIPDENFLMQWAGPKYTFPLIKEQLKETIKLSYASNPTCYIFKSILKESNITIGHIQIMEINYTLKECKLGRVLIGDIEQRGKGLGHQMVKLAVEYAFEIIGLNRIILGVFDFNKSALNCYKKIGFKEYEFKEKAIKVGNDYWNLIMMDLLKNNYKENSKNVHQ